MEQMKLWLDGSQFWRVLNVICLWFRGQWAHSGVIRWFLHPQGWCEGASQHTLLFKVWSAVRNGLSRLYHLLRLDRLFSGSAFLQPWIWCALPDGAPPQPMPRQSCALQPIRSP